MKKGSAQPACDCNLVFFLIAAYGMGERGVIVSILKDELLVLPGQVIVSRPGISVEHLLWLLTGLVPCRAHKFGWAEEKVGGREELLGSNSVENCYGGTVLCTKLGCVNALFVV